MEGGRKRELWFRIRRRSFSFRGSPSLLVTCCGEYTYSVTHRRYIFTSRHRRYISLTRDLGPVIKAYRSLHRLGMSRWPEYDERARREITRWKHRLMDAYWDAAPDERRASAAARHRLRARCKDRMLFYPILACEVAVLGRSLAREVRLGIFTVSWAHLCILLAIGLLICFAVAIMEGMVMKVWADLSRSEMHDALEFEWTN